MTIIHVCIGSACHLKGAYNVIHGLQKIVEDRKLEDQIIIKANFCLGECTKAVSVRVNDNPILSVDEKNVETFFEEYVLGRV
ncbi:(2Fe-2S) ferredoxin domain-containing protein [Marinisporobacter balticus]|uniref:Thioredoxin-like protein n=1 Tax=Marinisporobacter balticus TaxID=2018667 RepID=A0A4R2KMP1_9FIRM|nr:(2Fe-2S) ferredoxin domain-containing protein [Marinisporobacter balticus]TCO74973.1 thioredoxin-like protein [Marinisporobacter balticus]